MKVNRPIKLLQVSAIFLLFSNMLWAQQPTRSTVDAFKVTITFAEAPQNTPVVYQAPLKYNKNFALVLHMDNGDPAISTDVLPYFKGQNGNPGLFFTEGQQGSNQPFKMDAVHYSFNEEGVDIHGYQPGYMNWDDLINLWAGEFGLVSNGLNSPPLSDPAVETRRSFSYTKRKTLSGTIPGGADMQVYVVPDGQATQLASAKENYLAVYYNGSGSIASPARVESLPSIQGLQLSRTAATSSLFSQVQSVANQSNADNHYIATFSIDGFDTPGFGLNEFKTQMNLVAATYGKDGNNTIWSTSSSELYEYLRIQELVTVNTTVNNNVVEITLSADEMPENFRFYCVTLVVEGESNIVDMVVEQPETLSTYGYSGSNALLNLKWNGKVVADAEQRATAAVEVAENNPIQANGIVAMDYVLMLPEGSVQDALHDRLCALSQIDYDAGFCPPNEFLGADTSACVGSKLTFVAPDAVSYLWSTGETTQTIEFEVNELTDLWAQVTDVGSFVFSDTVRITPIELPVVEISQSADTIGPGEAVTLSAAGAETYLWSNDSITPQITVRPELTTTYLVEGTSAAGCSATAEATVVVQYETTLDFTYDTVCFGDSTTLISQIASNDSVLIKEWDLTGDGVFGDATGDTVKTLYTEAGERLTGLRIKTKSGAIHIQYHAVPVADSPSVNFDFGNTCEGQAVLFSDKTVAQLGVPASWTWDFGDGTGSDTQNASHFYDAVSTYEVKLLVTTNYGCTDSITRNVSIRTAPSIDLRTDDGTAVADDQEISIPVGGSVTLQVLSVYDSLEWTGGLNTPTFKIINEGFFDVTIYNNGCSNSRFFSVIESGTPPVNPTEGIMNLITPNGDGYNDTWQISDLNNISPAQVTIYSRAGRQVYSTNDYNNDWNGTFNGNPLPEGTYYYIIQGANGELFKGPISILR